MLYCELRCVCACVRACVCPLHVNEHSTGRHSLRCAYRHDDIYFTHSNTFTHVSICISHERVSFFVCSYDWLQPRIALLTESVLTTLHTPNRPASKDASVLFPDFIFHRDTKRICGHYVSISPSSYISVYLAVSKVDLGGEHAALRHLLSALHQSHRLHPRTSSARTGEEHTERRPPFSNRTCSANVVGNIQLR